MQLQTLTVMTPKTLFNIILKLLGIFFIKDILLAVSQIVSVIPFLARTNNFSDSYLTLISAVLILVIYSFIAFFLIFKSSLIIEKLKLTNGFD